MILDHIQFLEEDDIDTGRRILSATYQAIAKTECDISTDDHIKRDTKLELAKAIRDQLVRDLSGFFDDSFTDEDVLYITHINHDMLDKMRQLAEITKYMRVEQVQKILTAYALLADLGFVSKEQK